MRLTRLTRRLRTGVGIAAAATVAVVGGTVSPSSATIPATLGNGAGAFTAVAVGTFVPPVPTYVAGSQYPCSVYTGYHATLAFPNGLAVDIESGLGDNGQPKHWAESPYGTYEQSLNPAVGSAFTPDCDGTGNGVGPVDGFTATVTGVDGTTPIACHLNSLDFEGTYQRGKLNYGNNLDELNIQFVFTGDRVGQCTGVPNPLTIQTTIPSVNHGTTVNGALDAPGESGVPIFSEIYQALLRPILGEAESACAGHLFPPACALGPAGTQELNPLP